MPPPQKKSKITDSTKAPVELVNLGEKIKSCRGKTSFVYEYLQYSEDYEDGYFYYKDNKLCVKCIVMKSKWIRNPKYYSLLLNLSV